jgi:hypothetical protein
MNKLTFGQAFFMYVIYVIVDALLIKYGLQYLFDIDLDLLGIVMIIFAFQLIIGPIINRSPKK